jgi:hypothetical protein
MKYGDKLKAIRPFRFQEMEYSKKIHVQVGNLFDVVSARENRQGNQGHCLSRAGRGRLRPRYFFSLAQLERYFEVVE